jgi:hypothetical protein
MFGAAIMMHNKTIAGMVVNMLFSTLSGSFSNLLADGAQFAEEDAKRGVRNMEVGNIAPTYVHVQPTVDASSISCVHMYTNDTRVNPPLSGRRCVSHHH